jgi:hypothetical protein
MTVRALFCHGDGGHDCGENEREKTLDHFGCVVNVVVVDGSSRELVVEEGNGALVIDGGIR